MAKRLQQLLAKRDQLQARIRNIESRERARDRRLQTRRKILLGALLEEWMKKDPELYDRVHRAMETFLKRAVDKEAFGGREGASEKVDTKEGEANV